MIRYRIIQATNTALIGTMFTESEEEVIEILTKRFGAFDRITKQKNIIILVASNLRLEAAEEGV